EESRALRETRQELKEARRELRESPMEEVARLARWLEEMSEGTSALLRSRQWKIGQALGELHRKALRRPENPTPADHLQEVIGQFRAWQEDGASQASGPPSGDGQGGPEKSDAVERP
ncbi:MAG TPA: hypothetical protein VK359_00750, partial [Rubrobacteraceae bacterium]|nr:hypothetical protein [Rubrobacteraceae bacterium]